MIMGEGVLLRALWPTCPKAAVAQRKHKTKIVVFIMILFWGMQRLETALFRVKELGGTVSEWQRS